MTDKRDLKKIVEDVFKSLTPKPGDSSYNCAQALLIVFNDFVQKDVNAFKFNRKDLYELITGKDAGTGVSLDLIKEWELEQDPIKKEKINERIKAIDQQRKGNECLVEDFMLNVGDALTLSSFHKKYNRDLILSEVEGDEWIAIDLNMLKTVEISF